MQDDNAYAYAKACGIIGKSFVGERISSLSGLRNLSELDRIISAGFHKTQDSLPQSVLNPANSEIMIIRRAVAQILSVINSYSQPPELLIRVLKAYECGDLKTCIHFIASGRKELPVLCDIGRFSGICFNKYPDINSMLRGSEYNFLLEDLKDLKPDMDFSPVEIKLDRHYYASLAGSLSSLSDDDRRIAQKLLVNEISLRNCVWALRLRSYYNKSPDVTGNYLMKINIAGFYLGKEAFESLKLPLDTRQSWKKWKWEKFLNAEETGAHWSADPRYFQNAASRYLYRLALHNFHNLPMSVSALFCFIKLKQFEEDLLTSIAEGLALGMDSGGVLKLLEAG
ncbi:MAG: V-type ATPase subunit [Treponema sp.]|nr:V-type ATPase subunit [Treponema sp.]